MPHTAAYLTPHILRACHRLQIKSILDLGCGNGTLCGSLNKAGFDVVGYDPDEKELELARKTYPKIPFSQGGTENIQAGEITWLCTYNFDAVVSTEVVEHLSNPRSLPRFASKVLHPGGYLIVSTPYHGYLKNLALSLTNKWDRHFSPLWDGGHIKFWSRNTLSKLLEEEGFAVIDFIGAGRMEYLWKSMIVIAKKL